MLTIASRMDVMNRLGRAMADPTRSRILLILMERPAYPAELAQGLGLTRSNVSNHLSCLRDCGIVVAVPQGRQTRYEIVPRQVVGRISLVLNVGVVGSARPRCTSLGRFHEMASWGRSSLYSIR